MPQDDRSDFEEANGYDNDKTVAIDPEGLIESNYDKVTDNFDEMNLREDLLRGELRVCQCPISFYLKFSVVDFEIYSCFLCSAFPAQLYFAIATPTVRWF